MEAGGDHCTDDTRLLYLKSAFLAMEPAHCIISLARHSDGGSISTKVQTFILEDCVTNFVGKGTMRNHMYVRNILQQLITAAESTCEVVEGLYEKFAYYLTAQLEDDLKENNKIYKHISFLSPLGHSSSISTELVVPLQCSLNMLEGDTGCALWPSSLFLSEFILSYREIFSNKFCFEVGSGVGLVGITLFHVRASKVILTDGDLSSLANMKLNLKLNHLTSETIVSERHEHINKIECKYLPWEAASEIELKYCRPEIVLGADIIYNPHCIPHLIQVLSILLNPKKSVSSQTDNGSEFTHLKDVSGNVSENEAKDAPVAFIATVIRNLETFNYFLQLATQSSLFVLDVTENMRPLNMLPYMSTYDRSSVHLLKVSFSCN